MSSDPLTHLPTRFINWRLTDDGRKLPCDPRTGAAINHLDPGNWQTLAAARQSEHPLAFVLVDHDPWFFIDLDKCGDGQGGWKPEATAIWQAFPGAMGEVSQSGRGLHIVGKCDPRQLADRKRKWDGWIEFYTSGRFIAFGPHGWHWIGGTAAPDTDWTGQLLKWAPQRDYDPGAPLPSERDPEWKGPEDDDELIAQALKSTGGALGAFGAKVIFKDLWTADAAKLAQFYPAEDRPDGLPFDHSGARMALLNHLAFWTGKDMGRMDRLMRRSGLMCKKWEDRGDIRVNETTNAIRSTEAVYSAGGARDSGGEIIDVELGSNLTVSEQIEYFRGCVYIEDMNRIFLPDGRIMKQDNFKGTYGGKRFQLDPTNDKASSWTEDAFKAFTQCRGHEFPSARNITWDPRQPTGAIINGDVNTWVEPDVESRPGDPSRFLDLLSKILPVERDRTIFLNYAASVVQNPGIKFQWAPVLQGVEGNGKTFISECVRRAVGEAVTHKPDAGNLTEKYNSWIVAKVFIVVEEIHMGDRREVMDMLKPLLTNLDVEVRRMAQEKHMEKNLANWMFLTNHRDAIQKTVNDRRFAVFFTAQQTADDLVRDGMGGDFFPSLWRWAYDEGFAFIAHYLRNFPVDPELDPAGACHRAPITSTTHEAVSAAVGRIEAEVIDAMESEEPGFRGGWVSSVKLVELLDSRGIRIGRGRLTILMRDLGYEACPGLSGGRASRPLTMEYGKRPVLYRKRGEAVGNDPTEEYVEAQRYQAPPAP